MKKRSMILALASMLGISAAATAVSGFAWFTTTTTASVAAHSYSVTAAQGSLKVEQMTAADINCTSAVNDKNVATITHAGTLTDVSSVDGKHFYKAYNFNQTESETTFAVMDEGELKDAGATWMSQVNNKLQVAVSWSLKVTNSATGNANAAAMNIFLSGSAEGGNPFVGTDSYAEAYRLAIFNKAGALVYMYSTADTGFASDAETSLDGTTKVAKYDTSLTQIVDATGATGENSLDANKQMLATLNPNASEELQFVVWCEGTITPDKTIEHTTNSVSLSLGLIGLNA